MVKEKCSVYYKASSKENAQLMLKKPKLLYCSNGGYFLRILPDGTVDGTKDRSDQHSKHPSHISGIFLTQGQEKGE